MDKEDKILNEFFEEMKASDAKRVTPEFQLPKKRARHYTLLGFAATVSIILLSIAYFMNNDEQQKDKEVILVISEMQGSTSLIQADKPMEDWQSPTQSLINDF